jgi:large subunit ribosomal protein L21
VAVVQSPTVPEPNGTLAAVVVSGGKQYRVVPGDRILVDRVAAEPGSEVALDRVLMVEDDGMVKVLPHELSGATVTARVLAHQRGRKIDVLRYKPKKRVRVRRGARAELTALEVISISAGLGGASKGDHRTRQVAEVEEGR